MATLRCPSSLVLRRILLAACVGCSVTRADEPRQPAPRTIMRVPAWIESLGRPDAVSRQQAGTAASPRPSRIETVPPDTRVIPVVDASPAKPAQQPGGLKRWIAERVATLPKPAARPVADEPAATPAEQETTPESAREATKQAADSLVTAPVAATPDEMPTLSIDPASFRGVHPGKTSREELETAWGSGEAFTREDGVAGLWWKVEPFERVEVMIESDTVASIRIKLLEPVAVADLARQLEISELRTVSILDEQGVSIGEVYPERGVVLSVKPGTRAANAILIEPLDPESFVLRAEGEIENRSAFAVADLEYAIQLDPKHVRAHRLLLAMASDQGKWTQALRLAETAAALDPADIWTQLKHASVLAALDRPDEAAAVLTGVTARENNSPLVTAQAERLLGRIALTGKKPDFQGAVDHFAEAIRRTSPLLVKRSPAVQSAAREVMLDAHLGTALAIAKGTWQQKGRVIPKWISRSETVVKEFKGSEAERQVLELQLCRGVLAASAASLESVEPLPWVKRILELRDRMGDSIKDPWRRRQIDWEVGQGLSDALTAAQKRGDATDMLDNATLTAAYLERGAEHRELTAAERTSIGELMFRVGIMYSLQRGDHATAVTWFDRAVPLWEGEEEPVTRAEAGRLGESYVSMAISYWQVDRREDALALSRHGVDLMVDAVGRRQIEERSLAVAYGNLSTMYAEEGDDEQSRKYAEMASRAEASGSTLR